LPRCRSIRTTLLVSLTGGILLAWLAATLLVYFEAWHEVDEVFDAQLARSARVLAALFVHEVHEGKEVAQRVRTVRQELGDKGLRAYPGLAALLSDIAKETHKPPKGYPI